MPLSYSDSDSSLNFSIASTLFSFPSDFSFSRTSYAEACMFYKVRSLKQLCAEKILKTYYGELDLYSHVSNFSDVVTAFKKLTPVLKKQTFCQKVSANGSDFERFLWYLKFVAQNFTYRCCVIEEKCCSLSDVNFVGYNYLNGKLSVALKNNHRHGPNLNEASVDKTMFVNTFVFKDGCSWLCLLGLDDFDLV